MCTGFKLYWVAAGVREMFAVAGRAMGDTAHASGDARPHSLRNDMNTNTDDNLNYHTDTTIPPNRFSCKRALI